MKRYFLLFFLLGTLMTLRSQSYEVGLYGGVSYYDGDLGPNALLLYFQTIRPAYGVLARINMSRLFSIRGAYNHLNAFGDDAISNRNRGLSFKTGYDELSLGMEFNLFRLRLFKGGFYVEPYGYASGGIYHFEPRTKYKGDWITLQPLGTEGQGLPGYQEKYSLWGWSFVGGGGIKLRLSEAWILGFEGSGRIIFTDYLDDVSSNPVIYRDVLEGNGAIAAELSRPGFDPVKGDVTRPFVRGGPARDYLFTVGATLTYRFGPDINGHGRNYEVKCPQF